MSWFLRINERRKILLLLILVFFSLILYVGLLNLFPLGSFTDDALYVVLAQEVCKGSYRAIYTLANAPVIDPLPGYPLLLAPWVFFFGVSIPGLKFFSIFLTIVTGLCVFVLVSQKGGRWIALSLFLFNATTVRYSGIIMSEPAFLACSMLFILFFSMGNRKTDFFSGSLIALVCILRPQGVFLLFALILHLIITRTFKARAGILIGTPSLLLLAWLIRNRLVAEEWSGYLSNLFRNKDIAFHFGNYLISLKGVLGRIFIEMFFQVPGISSFIIRRILGWTLVLGTMGLMVRTYWKQRENAVLAIGFYFFLANMFFLPLWLADEMRYFYLLLPWVVILVCEGIFDLTQANISSRATRSLLGLCFGLLLGFHVKEAMLTFHEARRSPHSPKEYCLVHTLDWIHKNTDKNDVVLSNAAPLVYLVTGRKTSTLLWSPQLEKDPSLLRHEKFDWVLLSSVENVAGKAGSIPLRAVNIVRRWSESPGCLDKAYSNLEEKTEVYKVRPEARD